MQRPAEPPATHSAGESAEQERKRRLITRAAETAAREPSQSAAQPEPDSGDVPTTTIDQLSELHSGTNSLFLSEAAAGRLSPSPLPALERDDIPGYQILERISGGGQGAVYLALQKSIQRRVALKILHENTLADIVRFEREVAILGELRHPNVVTIYESGLHEGRPWFAMDYIRGASLSDHVAIRRPTLSQKLELLAKIAEAIDFVHRFSGRGIIHRDLKPSNILVDDAGEPHILDFGLAKATQSEAPVDDLTQTGQVVGSLPWASPEQAGGDLAQLDARSDIYSLGVLAYQIILGRFPYRVVGGFEEVAQQIRTVEPPPPRQIDPQLPADLSTLLLTCLEKTPADRYQTAGELASDLRRVLAGEPIIARRPSPARRLRRAVSRGLRRRPALAGAVVLVATMLLANTVGVAALYYWTPARHWWDALSFPIARSSAAPELSRNVIVIGFHQAEAELLVEAARQVDPQIPPTPPGLPAVATIGSLRPVHGLLARRLAAACARAVIFDIAFPTHRPELDSYLAAGLQAVLDSGTVPIGFRRTWNLAGQSERALLGTEQQELSPALVDHLRITCGEVLAADRPWRIPVYVRRTGWPPQPALAVLALAELRAPGADFDFEVAESDTGSAVWIHYRGRGGVTGRGGLLRESDRIDLLGRWSPLVATDTGLRPGDEVGLRWIEVPGEETLGAALLPYEWALTCTPEELARHVAGKAVLIGALGPWGDLHQHPDGRLVSGVWAQAVLLNDLLQDSRSVWFTERWINYLPTLCGALVGFLAAVWFPWSPVRRWATLAAGAAVLCGASILILWIARIHIAPLIPVFAALLACETGAFVRRRVVAPVPGTAGRGSAQIAPAGGLA